MLTLLLDMGSGITQTKPVTLQGNRWLTIEQVTGQVNFTPYQGTRRPARRGDRLSVVGDVLETNADAAARLTIDQQTGFVAIAENSRVQVQALSITPNGGRITALNVSRGQVRLRIRPLTNPETEIEIHTPAGVSGVRGTDFGVTVQPDGQTGVATLEGSVAVSAEMQTVAVNAEMQTSVYPGEAPEPPEPLRNDPTLFVERLVKLPNSTTETSLVRLTGYTDKVNLLKVNDDLKRLSRTGRFDLVVPIFNSPGSEPGQLRILATVITPLGTEQRYDLVVP